MFKSQMLQAENSRQRCRREEFRICSNARSRGGAGRLERIVEHCLARVVVDFWNPPGVSKAAVKDCRSAHGNFE